MLSLSRSRRPSSSPSSQRPDQLRAATKTTMSTRKGAGATRTRKPKHQNTFAFRHNPKSQKTAKILASVNAGLCASCHDKVRERP